MSRGGGSRGCRSASATHGRRGRRWPMGVNDGHGGRRRDEQLMLLQLLLLLHAAERVQLGNLRLTHARAHSIVVVAVVVCCLGMSAGVESGRGGAGRMSSGVGAAVEIGDLVVARVGRRRRGERLAVQWRVATSVAVVAASVAAVAARGGRARGARRRRRKASELINIVVVVSRKEHL